MALGALLVLGAGDGWAQQAAVCSDTPGPGERIACTEATGSSNAIDIYAQGVDIDTTDEGAHGVYGQQDGVGNVEIAVDGTDITTENTGSHAVYGCASAKNGMEPVRRSTIVRSRTPETYGPRSIGAGTDLH